MERDSSRCPDPEVLAAFVAGNLSGAELEMTVEHLRECEECRLTVGEAAQYDRALQPAAERKRGSMLPAWLLAAAAALAGFGYFSFSILRASRAHSPLRSLVAATPLDGRYLEPRLSGGFPWAPLRPAERVPGKPPEPSQMKLVGAAGVVIEQTSGDSSPDARHALAVARLLSGSTDTAAELLTNLAGTSSQAAIWSDLAAARYVEAVQTNDPPKLSQALAAADAALRLAPKLPEALFNRALILERLGLRDQARLAWKRYLEVDSGSPWTREGEKHLKALDASSDFPQELDRVYALMDRDPAAATALVDRFPQETRVWGESEILSRWAHREIAGEQVGAEVHLRLAELFGRELARRGERMLQEEVESIRRAGPVDRRNLANAHIRLREAQAVYKQKGPANAEPLFRESAAQFEDAQSPMASVARYFVANTTFEMGRVEEARSELEKLLANSRPGSRGNTAQMQWQMGMVYASQGHWGRALDTLQQSISGFEALGEGNYAMTVREILAEVYDRIGEPRKAWNHRIIALQELGRFDDLRLQVAIYAIARGAALAHDWPVGLSFVNLQLDMGRHTGDELMYVHILLLRASIEGRMGHEHAALDDLSRATASMNAIPDVAMRERAEAERLAVQGFLASSPTTAIDALSRAIDFQRAKGRRMFLPELLLHRGRAYAATGRRDQAAGDLEAGIRELEEQRISIAAGDQRWGMFGAADELFNEAVVLALQKDDAKSAFAYSERARSRELLDSMGMMTVPGSPPAIPAAVILEYVQLPGRLVIFVVNGGRLRVVQEEMASSVVAEHVERLTRSAASGDNAEFARAAALLYNHLLGPVADELASDNTLVVVPDGTLTMVPFAALIDPSGRYVIERRAVIVTPSVSVLANLPLGGRKLGRTARLLMVAGPASGEGDPGTLSAEQREIEKVVAEYNGNVDYAPREDVQNALVRRPITANVIHFVGHALLPVADAGGALLTSRDGQLNVREIASMRLNDVSVVVLAACGTARGRGRTGEPSISLARAFLAAGVPNVVATLWPIEDGPASEFFPQLHHYLVRGLPPAEALRAAQLECVHRRDVSPGVWAAVQIIGN